ncbi:SixA phosphatase family protein [Pseudochryseolinea flava]|uniref:Histidine phosphatase family protein n=1 Tax=Pseudochryseolinea flava TaxID=2059302 RepID=A0A364XYT6_9BACT|nr:histidine phosphatase family protein [Pseudochryseolinea flava]RAV99621.1 histidine phosphatase family protein [Pseudochryseolinea flava]
MPRFLYLLRHAQSADKQVNERDHDRELTPVGMKQSIHVGAYLIKNPVNLDAIMSSTAERAKATSNLIADTLKFDEEKIFFQEDLYEASTRTFFQFISQLSDDYQSVMCVAHNPAISYVAEYLTRAEIGDVVPSGLVIIKFNIHSWKEVSQGNGELIQYIQPATLNDHD